MENGKNSNVLLEEWICKVLLYIGIMPNLNGYYQLKDAVVLNYGSLKKQLTGDIYNTLSYRYNKAPSSIERNIRGAITQAFNSKALLKINNLLNVDFANNEYCLTNSQLISLIANAAYNKFGSL